MLSVRAFNQFTPLAHMWVTPPGWQEVVRAMENSSYFESLEAKTKEMYREKLSCVGLSIQDDPYLPKNDARFVNNMPSGQSSVLWLLKKSFTLKGGARHNREYTRALRGSISPKHGSTLNTRSMILYVGILNVWFHVSCCEGWWWCSWWRENCWCTKV